MKTVTRSPAAPAASAASRPCVCCSTAGPSRSRTASRRTRRWRSRRSRRGTRRGVRGGRARCATRTAQVVEQVVEALRLDRCAGQQRRRPARRAAVQHDDGAVGRGARHEPRAARWSMTKAVLPEMMQQRRGAIVNVASLSGLHGVVGQTNYSAAKGGAHRDDALAGARGGPQRHPRELRRAGSRRDRHDRGARRRSETRDDPRRSRCAASSAPTKWPPRSRSSFPTTPAELPDRCWRSMGAR